jgi:hypothetical protein
LVGGIYKLCWGDGLMPNIVKYQQSIAAEFSAQRDRVRFFIDDSHWGEDGRYKEILLSDFLRSVVPNNVGVGTGFVRNAQNELTNQIDILVYKKDYPCLFQKGDFVILMPESVLGIIEVKSFASASVLCKKKDAEDKSVIERCDENGKIIGTKLIFNGIWGYDSDINITHRMSNFRMQLNHCQGYLNHICFNSNIFCRYWQDGNPIDRDCDPRPCYSFYELSWSRIFNQYDIDKPGLAFGYFISNLLEYIYRQVAPQVLSNQYFEFLYPLENTKEMYRFSDCDIKQEHLD